VAPAPARLRVGDAESASPRELGSQGQTVGLAGRQARPSGTASVSRSVGPILLILSYESELLIYFWAKIQGSPGPTWTTLWARHCWTSFSYILMTVKASFGHTNSLKGNRSRTLFQSSGSY